MIYRDPDETERLLLELKARQRGMTLNEYFKHIGTPETPGSVPFIMLACFVAPFWREVLSTFKAAYPNVAEFAGQVILPFGLTLVVLLIGFILFKIRKTLPKTYLLLIVVGTFGVIWELPLREIDSVSLGWWT